MLASLSELRAIEEQRVIDEREAERAIARANLAAREAEARARDEAVAAQRRAEHEAALALEAARFATAREARLQAEAAEAAERTRQHAILAESRLAQEMELRRAEVAKRRPTWMLVVTAAATLAAFVLIYIAIDRTRASEHAKERERIAVAQKREMKLQLEDMASSLANLEGDLHGLAKRTQQALDDLATVETEAQKTALRARIERIKTEIRRHPPKPPASKPPRGPIEVDPKCLVNALC